MGKPLKLNFEVSLFRFSSSTGTWVVEMIDRPLENCMLVQIEVDTTVLASWNLPRQNMNKRNAISFIHRYLEEVGLEHAHQFKSHK